MSSSGPSNDRHEDAAAQGHDRSYLERTIATVRNHRDADNCWPSWANIFADEIERLWAENEQLQANQRTGRIIHGDA